MLIDDRLPPYSPPDRPVWEPNWRLLAWIAATVAAGAASALTAGIVSYVLLCLAVGCGGHAVTIGLPYGSGLRDYRQ